MRAGSLRHRVRLQREQATTDAGGGRTVEWVDVATVWARVGPISGRTRYATQQLTAEISHEVEIRYRPGIDETMRVLHRGRPFEIRAVLNPAEINERLILLCGEVKP